MGYVDDQTGLDTIEKQPSETFIRTIPFGGQMATGDTIANVDSIVSSKLSGTGTLVITGPTFSGTDAQCTIAGGDTGDRHKITAKVNTTNGEFLERDVLLVVNEE